MSNSNQNKPGGKKSGKRTRKAQQPLRQKPEQVTSRKLKQPAQERPEQLLSQTLEQPKSETPNQPQSPKLEPVAEKPAPVLSRTLEQPKSQTPNQPQSPKLEPVAEKPAPVLSQTLEQPKSETQNQPQSPKLELVAEKPAPVLSQQFKQLESPKPEPHRDGEERIQPAAASAPATCSIDFQTIATAYGDYTRRSLEETKAYVEKLSCVRSLDKAVEVQTEFAKQTYETFIAESRKIRELYRGLATQSFKPFETLVTNTKQASR